MYVIPTFGLSLVLCLLGGLAQLFCLIAVVVIVRALRRGPWIPLVYSISVLGPLVPLVMTFGLVESVHGFDLPIWMLALGAAAPLALAILAVECLRNPPVLAR